MNELTRRELESRRKMTLFLRVQNKELHPHRTTHSLSRLGLEDTLTK